MTIELALADFAAACLATGGDPAVQRSQLWQLEQMQLHVDSVQLTSEMTQSFANMLANGESILIPYQTNACDVQYLQAGGSYTLSVAKQYSRLATVFVSLGVADADTNVMTKEMNNFFLSEDSGKGGPNEVESHIVVNNQRWPQFDITGTKQHLHRLIKATGTWNSTAHAVCIGPAAYGDGSAAANMWVAGYDLEAVPQADSSGIPVQGGGTVQIKLKSVGDATRAYITTHFDAVLELKAMGAIAYS